MGTGFDGSITAVKGSIPEEAECDGYVMSPIAESTVP